nr:MAG TPA: chromosome partition protein [Caudoviricetes sp.]
MKELTEYGAGKSKLFDATYEVILPSDYLHILNCVCIY